VSSLNEEVGHAQLKMLFSTQRMELFSLE